MMELKEFIGKVVICAETKCRFILRRITSPCIEVTAVEKDAQGYCASYSWPTINGDPISTGALVFEDASLMEPFKAAYSAHCHTRDAYYEEIGYWMRRD
jgi:hypothetical protein